MTKKLNDWLDEFVENGADATDVTNWPENAGGGNNTVFNVYNYVKEKYLDWKNGMPADCNTKYLTLKSSFKDLLIDSGINENKIVFNIISPNDHVDCVLLPGFFSQNLAVGAEGVFCVECHNQKNRVTFCGKEILSITPDGNGMTIGEILDRVDEEFLNTTIRIDDHFIQYLAGILSLPIAIIGYKDTVIGNYAYISRTDTNPLENEEFVLIDVKKLFDLFEIHYSYEEQMV